MHYRKRDGFNQENTQALKLNLTPEMLVHILGQYLLHFLIRRWIEIRRDDRMRQLIGNSPIRNLVKAHGDIPSLMRIGGDFVALARSFERNRRVKSVGINTEDVLNLQGDFVNSKHRKRFTGLKLKALTADSPGKIHNL